MTTLLPGDLVVGRPVKQDDVSWEPCRVGLVIDRYYRLSFPYVKVLVQGKIVEYAESHLRRVDEEDGKDQSSLLQGR